MYLLISLATYPYPAAEEGMSLGTTLITLVGLIALGMLIGGGIALLTRNRRK